MSILVLAQLIAALLPPRVRAGVWPRDRSRAYRMGRTIKGGRIWTNGGHPQPAEAAFGRHKESDIGRKTRQAMLDHDQ